MARVVDPVTVAAAEERGSDPVEWIQDREPSSGVSGQGRHLAYDIF